MFFEDISYFQCRRNKVYHRILKTSLNPPTFIEVTVPSQESGWSFISVIDFATIYDFDIWFWNCSDSVVFFVFYFIIEYIKFEWQRYDRLISASGLKSASIPQINIHWRHFLKSASFPNSHIYGRLIG